MNTSTETSRARQKKGSQVEPFAVRLPHELIEWITSYAQARGITRNAATAEALAAFRASKER